jgi:hypothetical protein
MTIRDFYNSRFSYSLFYYYWFDLIYICEGHCYKNGYSSLLLICSRCWLGDKF